jgi:hypothetical protein
LLSHGVRLTKVRLIKQGMMPELLAGRIRLASGKAPYHHELPLLTDAPTRLKGRIDPRRVSGP